MSLPSQPALRAETHSRPLRYSLATRFLDWRSGTRDGRKALPVYAKQPAATATIRKLVAEFAGRAAAERAYWEGQKAPLERELAKVCCDIDAIQNALEAGTSQENPTSADDARSVQKRNQRKHARLAVKQSLRSQLEQDIAALHKQYLDRRNQLAAFTWRRIETYWDRLIRVHPDGERLNEVASSWAPTQIGGPLRQLLDLTDQVTSNDPCPPAITSSEDD